MSSRLASRAAAAAAAAAEGLLVVDEAESGGGDGGGAGRETSGTVLCIEYGRISSWSAWGDGESEQESRARLVLIWCRGCRTGNERGESAVLLLLAISEKADSVEEFSGHASPGTAAWVELVEFSAEMLIAFEAVLSTEADGLVATIAGSCWTGMCAGGGAVAGFALAGGHAGVTTIFEFCERRGCIVCLR